MTFSSFHFGSIGMAIILFFEHACNIITNFNIAKLSIVMYLGSTCRGRNERRWHSKFSTKQQIADKSNSHNKTGAKETNLLANNT